MYTTTENNFTVAKFILPTIIKIHSNRGKTPKEIVDIAFDYAHHVLSHPMVQTINKQYNGKKTL